MKQNVTAGDYHAHDSLGSSSLKQILQTKAHFKAYKEGLIEFSSKAFDIGTAAHSAVLEKDFAGYVEGPDVNKNTKIWKAFVAENPEKIVLKPSEMKDIKGMFDAFFANELARKILKDGQPEVSYFTELNGLEVKARLDFFIEHGDESYIVDYKTAQSATPREFMNAVFRYHYDLSAAHYMNVVEEVTGKRPKDFIWIVQEKTAPYAINIFRASDDVIYNGNIKCEKAMKRILEAKESGSYPAYEEKITEIELPEWAVETEDRYE